MQKVLRRDSSGETGHSSGEALGRAERAGRTASSEAAQDALAAGAPPPPAAEAPPPPPPPH